MNSSRPYILRALHEWIVDNECTPHLLVDINHPQVKVPPGYAADGQIVLNAAPAAVRLASRLFFLAHHFRCTYQ